MNYEDMSYFEINKAVAFAIRGRDEVCVIDTSLNKLVRTFNGNPKCEEESGWFDFDPCNNPSDAWPIIVENRINIEWRDSLRLNPLAKGTAGNACHWSDKNPLRAAMICFLKMKDAEK